MHLWLGFKQDATYFALVQTASHALFTPTCLLSWPWMDCNTGILYYNITKCIQEDCIKNYKALEINCFDSKKKKLFKLSLCVYFNGRPSVFAKATLDSNLKPHLVKVAICFFSFHSSERILKSPEKVDDLSNFDNEKRHLYRICRLEFSVSLLTLYRIFKWNMKATTNAYKFWWLGLNPTPYVNYLGRFLTNIYSIPMVVHELQYITIQL